MNMYEANLVSAVLLGKEWGALHESFESTVQQMMKLVGVNAQIQAANFMPGKLEIQT